MKLLSAPWKSFHLAYSWGQRLWWKTGIDLILSTLRIVLRMKTKVPCISEYPQNVGRIHWKPPIYLFFSIELCSHNLHILNWNLFSVPWSKVSNSKKKLIIFFLTLKERENSPQNCNIKSIRKIWGEFSLWYNWFIRPVTLNWIHMTTRDSLKMGFNNVKLDLGTQFNGV